MAPEFEIIPENNGPYHVKGKVTIVTQDGRVLDVVDDAYLCRCGHSSTKPFCDGTHEKVGFESDLDLELDAASPA